jgi:hypothetical protein
MAKRRKMPRGYYKEIKTYGLPKAERIKAVEFWLRHNNDMTKDIRFYVYWRKPEELVAGWDYIGAVDKSEYLDHVLMRHIVLPRTRREKAIYSSIISVLRHLSEIN